MKRCTENLIVGEPKNLTLADKLDRFAQKVKDGEKTRLTTDDKELYKFIKMIKAYLDHLKMN